MLDVKINDKLQKLVDLLAVDNISGTLVFRSNILGEEKLDLTFAKLFVKNGDKIGVMVGLDGHTPEPLKWFRLADYTTENYDGVANDRYHAISFIPKHKIYFMARFIFEISS